MKRRHLIMLPGAALALAQGSVQGQGQTPTSAESANARKDLPEHLLLKDFRPKSIYKVPQTQVARAKFPVIDAHVHATRNPEEVADWIKLMDRVGVEKVVLFVGASTGEAFAEARKPYEKYPGRFDLWCGLDFSSLEEPNFGTRIAKSLEDCHRLGALGVGEVMEKGFGYRAFRPGAGRGGAGGAPRTPPKPGPHADDPRMDPVWQACARLGMPVNHHFSDPVWSYLPMDATNDGLMNAWRWRIDDKAPGILGHEALIQVMERVAGRHPKTVFVAAHLANLDYDLTRLGQIFDRHPNLYADISARFGETAPIPRAVNRFLRAHPDRIVYGTDMPYNQHMFSNTFRILETEDEHFYDSYQYHSPLYGFGLPDDILKRLYRENILAACKQARASAA